MRYIKTDMVSGIVASQADASFPASFLSNAHPQKPWKAVSNAATLTVTVSGNADCVGFYRTNAVSAIITVKDAAGVTVLWGPEEYDLSGIMDFYDFFTQDGYLQNKLMAQYEEQFQAHQVVIELEAVAGVILYVGVLRVGLARTIAEPRYGFEEYLVDYSVKDKHPNGSDYYDLGEIVTGYQAVVSMDRDSEFMGLMRRLAKQIGETPIFWQVTTLDSPEWTVFGKFDGLPRGRHGLPNDSEATIRIIEVI